MKAGSPQEDMLLRSVCSREYEAPGSRCTLSFAVCISALALQVSKVREMSN